MSLYVGTEKVAPIIRIFEEGGEPVNINNQAKTVTPTKSEQTIKHDDGYTGLGTVTVNPIPDDYIIPTGNISITENGTAINVHDYDNATVNVQPSLQEKLVTLSRDSQDITSDSGYYGLSRVSVPGIPSEYIVPSGAKTITTNGTVNVTEFAEAKVNVQPALQDKTATPTKSAQQIKADTTYYGLGTVTVAPIPDNYVIPTGNVSITSNGTHNVSGKVNAVVNVKPALEAKTVSPMTTSQVITPSSADYYGLSKVTVNAVDSTIDSNIKASNIVKGVSILGVEGGYTPSTESKSVSLDFSSSSTINVTPTNENTYLTSVSISKPLELVPANIANGTTIAGITGTYVTPISTESKTITDISFASGNYKVTPSAGKYLESVTVNRPSTLEAGNIKSGVSIAGVEGTYTGTFSGTKELTDLTTYDVSGFKYAKVTDANLIASNIREGVQILGLTGTYHGADYTLQSKTIAADFSAGSMNITPDSGYNFLSNVTVSKPSTLVASNIKEGVSVAGITGTYKGTFAGTATITDTSKVDVSGKQYAQVVDNNLTANNIKEGVTILGVTGTLTSQSSPNSLSNKIIECTITSLGADDLAEVTKIGDYAFYFHSKLKSIIVPRTVSSIGQSAFENCKNLNSVEIASQEVKARAFAGCSSISSLNIKYGCTSINFHSFDGCTSIKNIVLPQGFRSLGQYAFANCTNLETVTIADDPNAIVPISGHPTMFNGCTKLSTIIVPKGWGDQYKSDAGWKNYAGKIIESN